MGMLQFCATGIFRSILRDPKKMKYVASSAAQLGYVAILRDQNVSATLPDPKNTFCDFGQLKKIQCDFARPSLRFELDVSSESSKTWYALIVSTPTRHSTTSLDLKYGCLKKLVSMSNSLELDVERNRKPVYSM